MSRSGLLLITAFFVGGVFFCVYGGTTGKISGKVVDTQTGEGIMGANVVIIGTTMGAATDLDGNYFIINVPPGVYDLRATVIGYDTLVIRNVQVLSDKTTTVNFKLSPTVLKAKEVQIVAKRPPVEKDITATSSYVTSDEIKSMPVQTVGEVLTTKTGVIARGGDIHMRGGRETEVSYLIDGMPVNDPIYGYQAVGVATNAVQEVNAIVGSFNAEYGNAMSGVVNIITKEGNPTKYSGNLVWRTNDLGFGKLNEFVYSYNKDRIEFNISGPEPITTNLLPRIGLDIPRSNRLSFFFSYTQENDDGEMYNRVWDFDKHIFKREILRTPYLLTKSGWFGILPKRQSNYVNLTLKLKQRLSSAITYSVSWINSWNEYNSWDWDYYYTPATSYLSKYLSRQISFSLTHTLSPRTFYELKISNMYTRRELLPGGGKTPADFKTAWYGQGEQLDDWTDINGDGIPQVRLPYLDLNNNGKWDLYEPWKCKVDSLGRIDTTLSPTSKDTILYDYHPFAPRVGEEPWWDWNNNWICDPKQTNYGPGDPLDKAEPYEDGEPFVDYGEEDSWVDANGNGLPDIGEFDDRNHNGVMDMRNGVCDYFDINGNGRYDVGEPGEQFTDANGNGYYDFPDGKYEPWESYFDINHNMKWDDADSFLDRGCDQWAVWQYRSVNLWQARWDLTSQVNNNNLIKTGIEFKWNKLTMKEIQYPEYHYDQPPDGHEYPEHGIFRFFYDRTPKSLAWYVQDKMEYGSLIANVGVRFDMAIQASEVLSDSAKRELLFILQGWETDIFTTRLKISPRLGISYPITDRSKLFFSYGHFYQLPGYDYLYQTPTMGSSALRLLGNPNLDYEKTVSYELGVAYAPTDNLTLRMSGYYKDIFNLLNTSRHRLGLTSSISQDVYKNLDYGRSRGIEVQIDKHYSNYWTASINYQFAYAYGKSSSNRSGYDAVVDKTAIPLRDLPLDWDRRHMLNVSLDLHVRENEHPKIFGIKLPSAWGINLLWQWGSGFPYTPDKDNPFAKHLLSAKSWERTNALRLPAYSRVDLKANKDFTIKGVDLSFFIQVDNLTNRRNVLSVYKATGLPDDSDIKDGWGNGDDHDKNPGNWSAPRQIDIGVEISF